MIQKGKVSLYSNKNYIQLQSVVSSITPQKYTVQAVPSKKKLSREKEEREKRWKRGEEEKRDGKSLCERKGKMENEMWKKEKRKEERMKEKGKKKKGEEDKEEWKIEKAAQEMYCPLWTHSLARS